MDVLLLAALAFLTGLTACGIAASLLELAARCEVRFSAPFTAEGRPARSAAAILVAGPFMLGNDALAARRDGGISAAALCFCAIAAGLWLTSVGIVLLALASAAFGRPA